MHTSGIGALAQKQAAASFEPILGFHMLWLYRSHSLANDHSPKNPHHNRLRPRRPSTQMC